MNLLNPVRLMPALLALCLMVSGAALAGDDKDSVWIDVRTPQEYSSGHLDGATNIPHTAIGDKIASLTDDKSAPIKLYCKSGGRAGMAKKELEEMGYTNVTNVGGLDDAKEMTKEE